MTLFTSDDILISLAAAFLPDHDVRPRTVTVDGVAYRALVDERGRPHTQVPFLDVLEPMAGSHADALPVNWLERVETERLAVDEFEAPTERAEGQAPSVAPYTDWSTTGPDFDDFIAVCRKNSSRAFRQIRKRPAAIEKALGADAVFTHDDRRREHLTTCIEWKRRQYVASGGEDLMALGGEAFFTDLYERGRLVVSTVTVEERLVAAHLGVLHEGTMYYWVPAYDVDVAKYSPGSLLLEEMLRASHARGDKVFDFLEGFEPYKMFYATHVRVLSEVGTPPISRRAVAAARPHVQRVLDRWPRLNALVERIRPRLNSIGRN